MRSAGSSRFKNIYNRHGVATMEVNLEERVARERAWHDSRFSNDKRQGGTGRFYKALEAWYKDYADACINSSFDKGLEVGAGLESLTTHPDMFGRKILAIDISPVVVEKMRHEIKHSSCDFIVADAHCTGFQESNFDLIFARGVLHHLDLIVAVKELKRILAAGGTIIFAEPLSGNPLIRFFRFITPHLRTPDERPLSRQDINFICSTFGCSNIRYYGFITLLTAFISGRSSSWAKKVDDFILNKLNLGPFLAWAIIMDNRKT